MTVMRTSVDMVEEDVDKRDMARARNTRDERGATVGVKVVIIIRVNDDALVPTLEDPKEDTPERQKMLHRSEFGSGLSKHSEQVQPVDENGHAELEFVLAHILRHKSRGCLLYTSPSPRD